MPKFKETKMDDPGGESKEDSGDEKPPLCNNLHSKHHFRFSDFFILFFPFPFVDFITGNNRFFNTFR